MTDALRDAAQAALDELEQVSDYWDIHIEDAKRVGRLNRIPYCERQRDRFNSRVSALRAALAEPAPEPSGWINCSEPMQHPGGKVLVWVAGDGSYLGDWHSSQWGWSVYGCEDVYAKVTHWMPLPAAPSAEGEA